jgi:hypothetical protein
MLQRFLKAERTLNDLVEDIHRILVADEEDRLHLPDAVARFTTSRLRKVSFRRQYLCGDDDPQQGAGARRGTRAGRAEGGHDLKRSISSCAAITVPRKERRYMLEAEIVPQEGNGDHE